MTERDIFLAALEIAGSAERAAYVARACGDDQALRNQVEELLRAHDETSQFLETPAAATNAVADRTVIGDSSTEDDDDDGPPSSEAEFAKYLEPATRPGWIGRLGHYEIEQILGRGAFGIVAKAFDDKLHRVVAIKFMNPTLAATSPPRKRFLREARTAAAVTHENIVAIYAVEEEPIPYLVMEYIPGQTLQQRMDANGPFDVPEILKLGRQIASGLAAAHAANLIHRDIKPANILLTGGTNERAKISDFGLARAVDDASLTSSGLIAGTPMYMSPEQARGETLDHRTDLFSLGSVLYQMASGRPPFRAANTIAVLKRVCEDRPRPLDDVMPGAPEWLQTIIFRLMEKDPGNRYQSADEVAELLERYETELRHHGRVKSVFTVPETQVLKRDKSPRAASRKKPLAWLIAGVTALVLIVGFVVMNGGKTPLESIPIVSQRTPPTTPSEQAAITWKPTPEQQSFFEEVAGLTLVGQVKAVEKKLSEENPGFLGTGNVSFDDGKVSTLNISGDRISDLWPVRAFPGLTSLICNGTQGSAPKLQDLSSLVGIKLTNLSFANTSVSDLSPLAGMPLERLECFSTKVSDLGPLSGMPLTYLNIANTSVSNLAPLSGSPLSYFSCSNTRVDDLAPLAGAPLTTCHLRLSRVTDLSPLKGAPLTTLTCNEELIASHRDLLRGIKTLETINGRPAKEWLDESSYGWPADAPALAIAPFDAEQAKKHQEEWAAYLKVPVEYTNSIGMKFRLIPPGEFLMGSTPEEIEAALKLAGEHVTKQEYIKSEGPQHRVILSQPVYFGITEVTQSQYERVIGTNPSHFSATGDGKAAVASLGTSNHPVEMVSWNDAAEFCTKLSQQEKLNPFYFRSQETVTPLEGTGYRLPTEAEWEYACRAGTITQFWNGTKASDLNQAGWYDMNSGGRTHAVGELPENPFGLSDVHGNVWEWVQDGWDPNFYSMYKDAPAVSPYNPFRSDARQLIRGGNWSYPSYECSSTIRAAYSPKTRRGYIGFRVTLTVDAVRQALSETPIAATPKVAIGWHGWPADAPKPAIAPFDADQAKKHQEEWAAYLKVPVEYTNSIGMKFRLIPPGEFLMGSSPEEIAAALADVPSDETNWRECIQSEAPKHRVILTQAFYLGTNEVTQSEYASVVGAKPSHFAESGAGREAIAGMDTSRHPVETVSWIDASDFCAKLCQSDKLKPYDFPSGGAGSRTNGTGYRLPTEAEWEFACRAGTITRFWSGESEYDLAETAWFQDNSGWKTHEVATLKENPLGLYDMHGNVWEWVLDDWEPSYYRQFAVEPAIDPLSRGGKRSQKIVRGGPKSSGAVACRCANRNAAAPTLEGNSIGFRVALSVDSVKGLLSKGDLTKTTASPSNWHGWPVDAPRPAIAPFDTEQGMQHQQAWAKYLGVPVEYENSIGMKFRLIPPGEFLMGSTPEEIEAALPIAGDDQIWQDCIRSEGPMHQVILTQPFYLGTNEVTQSQFQQIMEANPSRFAVSGEWADSVKGLDTGRFPVESVDWASARDFCQQLAKREGLQPTASNTNGLRLPFGTDPYRLPAEAEWEFACRAGSATQFSTGDTSASLSKVGWFDDNSSERTHAIGELPANAFGLHDMHGNVWEWVLDAWQADRYAARAEKRAIDPFDPMTKDSEPLTRGGNWSSYAEACRSASRCSASSAYSSTLIGFRVAMSVAAVKGLVAKKQSDMAKLALRTFPNWPADAPPPAIAPFDANQAKKHQEEWAAYLKVPVEYTNSIGMKFRLIPPGEFLKGGTPEEIAAALEADLTPFNGDFNWWSACLRSEGPRHRVRLTRPFYLGAHEVTQQQYQTLIGENPSENSPSGSNQERVAGLDTANFPVEFLSWHDAVQFCNRLNEREQRSNQHLATMPPTLSETGTGYRLPTEAEWEFACRAGTTSRYWTGHDVDSVLKAGWFQVNDGGRTHAVGELLANPFGLFDVHGNAWEWTADGWDESWYQQFADKLAVDPVCPLTDQPVAMMKTGTWPAFEHFCRAASRIPWPCDARNSLQGMRVTLSVEAVQEAVNAPAASMPDAE